MKNVSTQGVKSINDMIGNDEVQENINSERSAKKSKNEKNESKNNNSIILNDKSEIKILYPEKLVNQKKEDSEKIKKRRLSAEIFEKFINESGINSSFQLILTEIIHKKIPVEDHFSYAAGRLRQIGREIETIKNKITSK